MNQSLSKFKQEFLDAQLEMVWRQWSALGVIANSPPEQKRVIDAEALFAYTLSIGGRDKRLFQAALEWLGESGDWLSVSRFKSALSLFSRPDAPLNDGIISIDARSLFKQAVEHQGPRWASIVRLVSEQTKSVAPSPATANFETRGILGPVNLRQPALAQFQLRALFGVEARADIFLFFLFNDEGNSNSIAKEVFADQGNVYKTLEKWTAAGILVKTSGQKTATYSLANKEKWFGVLGLNKKLAFVNWMRVFHVFGKISIALTKQPWADDEYLVASLFRDIRGDLQPLAKQLKMDLPEPTLDPGAEFFEPFSRTLVKLADALRK